MKRMLCALAASALTFMTAASAQADSYSPAATVFRFSGTMRIDHAPLTWYCNVNLQIHTQASGAEAAVTSMNVSSGDPMCGLYNAFATPFTLDVVSTTTLNIQNVYATPPGTPSPCGPTTVSVGWDGVNQKITFTNALVGPVLCLRLNGTLTKTLGPSLTIAP